MVGNYTTFKILIKTNQTKIVEKKENKEEEKKEKEKEKEEIKKKEEEGKNKKEESFISLNDMITSSSDKTFEETLIMFHSKDLNSEGNKKSILRGKRNDKNLLFRSIQIPFINDINDDENKKEKEKLRKKPKINIEKKKS